MAFRQFDLDRATIQTRGIFNEYVYDTDDLIDDVQQDGYFAEARFAVIDGPGSDTEGWITGVVTCRCSDGPFLGEINQSGNLVNVSSGPGFSNDITLERSSSMAIPADADVVIFTGAFTQPLIPLAESYKRLTLTSLTGTIVVDPDGTELINGLATRNLALGESITITKSSTGWRTV